MGKIDDMRWHTDGEFPADLPAAAAGTHLGMFLAWLAAQRLVDESILSDADYGFAALSARAITPGAFLIERWGGALSDDVLTPLGARFAAVYYDADEDSFLDDYVDEFWDDGETIYHVPDTWMTYDRIAARIDDRLSSLIQQEEPLPPVQPGPGAP